ncbi:ubiquitin family protein [Acidisoma sp. C75]
MNTVRVALPTSLCVLAGTAAEVRLACAAPATLGSVLDSLEAAYPMLRGTIRDQGTKKRRPFVRFFACREDLSHATAEDALPDAVARGEEAFIIIGAIAGG